MAKKRLSKDKRILERNLNHGVKMINEHGVDKATQPKDIYHSDYGWVLKDGKATENTETFNASLEIRIARKDEIN